jgi:hypothetical protein
MAGPSVAAKRVVESICGVALACDLMEGEVMQQALDACSAAVISRSPDRPILSA